MALNDISLCSRALVRLGANPITSFDDGTAESEIAGALFAPIRDALLSAYPWTFATGQLVLTKLDTDPVADYQNAFQLPNDFLRAISAGGSSKGRGMNYRLARGELHSNHEDITLTYIFRPTEEEFPPFFDLALIAKLSAEFCIPVTENTSRAEAFYRLAEQEYARARQIDAQQDSPNHLENFTLIDVR
ncbi:MAG TPA: hypothetical protein PLF01_06535 [Alphaproteobacteria bacterium]|nr:hypothetical protein [Alphaproteobacteria bacterium]